MRRPSPVCPSVTARSLPPRQSQRTVGGVCLSVKNAQPTLPVGERNMGVGPGGAGGAGGRRGGGAGGGQRRRRAMARRSLSRPAGPGGGAPAPRRGRVGGASGGRPGAGAGGR